MLEGSGVVIKSLTLNGALVINAVDGAEVVVDGFVCENPGWNFVPVAFEDDTEEEKYRIRGYKSGERLHEEVFNIASVGKYVIDGTGLRVVVG